MCRVSSDFDKELLLPDEDLFPLSDEELFPVEELLLPDEELLLLPDGELLLPCEELLPDNLPVDLDIELLSNNKLSVDPNTTPCLLDGECFLPLENLSFPGIEFLLSVRSLFDRERDFL
uniref:Cerebellar degeneration-related antigen 1 n=1 Tax=Strongyloides papillosus TaxID=174720 RepID=A0A0N5BLF8_STREA